MCLESSLSETLTEKARFFPLLKIKSSKKTQYENKTNADFMDMEDVEGSLVRAFFGVAYSALNAAF